MLGGKPRHSASPPLRVVAGAALLFVTGVGVGFVLQAVVLGQGFRGAFSPQLAPGLLVPPEERLDHARPASRVVQGQVELTTSQQSKWWRPDKDIAVLAAAQNITGPMQDTLPTVLADAYPSMELGSGRNSLAFHWVVKTCPRPGMSRYLSQHLLSGLLGGLKPASISIVFCRPFTTRQQQQQQSDQDDGQHAPNMTIESIDPDELPSLIYNLRHSHQLNVFNVPKVLAEWKPSSTLNALTVPYMLKDESLPLLITEDDTVFASDANARVALAVSQVLKEAGTEPWALTMYWGHILTYNTSHAWTALPVPSPDLAEAVVYVGDDMGNTTEALPPFMYLQRGYQWGTQVQMYSPGMTQMLRHHFERSWAARFRSQDKESDDYRWGEGGEDVVILGALDHRYKCNRGGKCHAFILYPSLVQHVGTTSTHFSVGPSVNSRFHFAKYFPSRMRLPSMDPTW